MKNLTLIFFLAFSINSYSQTLKSNVEFVGNKIQVLQARADLIHVSGKLSTGEIVNTGCDHGACYFRIEYKGRTIQKVIGGDITKMSIYEYDFGGDGDNELVVINDSDNTSFLYIYSYGRGVIQKIFEKEILYYRTVLKKDYIEFYMPSGLDMVWNYYQGQFWEMKPVDQDKFRLK